MLGGLGRFVIVSKLICDSSILIKTLRTASVLVSVLGSSVVDRKFEPRRVKTKTTKLLFDASPLSIKVKKQRCIGGRYE